MQTIRAAKLQGVGDKFFERKKIYKGEKSKYELRTFSQCGGNFDVHYSPDGFACLSRGSTSIVNAVFISCRR